jgi:signal peptidase II
LKAHRLFVIGLTIAFFTACFDLLSKRIIFAILENLAVAENTNNPQIRIFSFFSIVYVWNRGVSFGMFNWLDNSQVILSLLQGSIAFVLMFWLYRNKNRYFTIGIGLIIGGAFGNLIDRIQNGAVADFLDFYIGNYHWPAFNVADSAVFIGVVILLVTDFLKQENDGKKR